MSLSLSAILILLSKFNDFVKKKNLLVKSIKLQYSVLSLFQFSWLFKAQTQIQLKEN